MRFRMFYNVYGYKKLSNVTHATGVRCLLLFRRKPGFIASFLLLAKQPRNKKTLTNTFIDCVKIIFTSIVVLGVPYKE